MTKVLVDTIPLNFELIEDASGSGKLIARGPFARGDQPTANGRFYPAKLWNREIAKLESKISGNSLFGMLDHPKDGKSSLKEASHLIRSLRFDGNQVVGELEVLNTPMGNIAKAIIESGAKIGVSSRGLGSTRKDSSGRDVVQDDYRLLTFDLVADPASSTAWPEFATEDTHVEDATMAMTADELRSRYPDLVRQIEAGATASAPTAPAGPSHKEMEEKLLAMVAEQRAELEDRIRGEMLSDPDIGGSRLALESVTRILRPYLLSEDAEAVVQNKEEEIRGLRDRISGLEENLGQQQSMMEEIVGDLETAARLYFMEKKLNDHAEPEEKERITSMMGDVSRFGSHGEFKDAMASCCERIIEDNERAEAESEEVARLTRELAEKEEALAKAIRLANALGSRAYAEKRLASHPHAPALREAIDSRGAISNEQVDQIIESWDAQHDVSEDFNRVQRSLRGGVDHIPNDEEGDQGGNGAMVEDTLFGVSQRELQELAGISVSDSLDEDNRPY